MMFIKLDVYTTCKVRKYIFYDVNNGFLYDLRRKQQLY